jgi:peptide/nickel transport system permease protein
MGKNYKKKEIKFKKSKGKKHTNMIKYIIKRIIIVFPMLIFSLIITFLLARMMLGSPILFRVGYDNLELLESEMERVGFNEPWYIQLLIYFRNFFSGNWGESYVLSEGMPVLQFITEILPKTIELMIIPTILTPIIAVKLGATAARHKDKLKDNIIRVITIIGAGFPVFWIAILLQIGFGVYITEFTDGQLAIPVQFTNTPGLIPPWSSGITTGFRTIDSIIYNDQEFLFDTILHLILPSICMVFLSLAGISRLTRSSMLEVLDSDYIRTARAKGVEEDDVINKHALRNALIPTSNLVVAGVVGSVLGSIFIEMTFDYRGFGWLFLNAITAGDYLLINGFMVFAVIITLVGVLIADVMYTIIDPRITYN